LVGPPQTFFLPPPLEIAEYDYVVAPYPQQQVPYWEPPPPEEEEEEEEAELAPLPVEEYQPPCLSEGRPSNGP
jgi:hypothetical protein